jgi:hypothetical protein
MFDKISTKLFSLLNANTLIQSKYNYEATKLEGFPALTLTASANENEYSTTTENNRAYAFVIRLYVLRGSGPTAENDCENTMRELVDTVLDTLDKNYNMVGLETQTGYMFLNMYAAPSTWGYAGRENEMRVAEIKVQLHFNIDTTLIS